MPPTKPKRTALRAVGYCRTSGEGQRDNTSIPSQKEAIEKWCEREGYQFIAHYVDEAKSGAKVAGRDEFQRLMKDAVAGGFDIAVVYQISRWGRDGTDIMDSARTLQRDFGIDVVDTAGQFDTRDRTNRIGRFIFAGLSEQERVHILQRTLSGRIARAKAGLPWCGAAPTGRAYDQEAQKWVVTDKGREIARLLKKYAEGASVAALGREFEKFLGKKFTKNYFKTLFSKWVREAQLTGPYTVHFTSDEIGLKETVLVPGIPEVVSPELMAKVKARLAHNRTFNRDDAKQYLLSGFIYCAECGRALTGQTTTPKMNSLQYYRHDVPDCPAPWMSVRGEKLTEVILDYLYRFFLDEPAFNAAVQKALPTNEQREELVRQRQELGRQMARTQKKLDRLVKAVADGASSQILIREQDSIIAEMNQQRDEAGRLDRQIASLPSPEEIARAATLVRLELVRQHKGKNWRKLSPDSIKRFLHHLFGDTPKLTGTGIFVTKDESGNITARFKGLVEIPHTVSVADGVGRAVSPVLAKEAARLSHALKEGSKTCNPLT